MTASPPEQSPVSLADLVRARRSCRAYRSDPVPREALGRMLETARLAPSACNRQPWRFAVVLRPDLREAIATRGLLPGMSAGWVAEAPVLVVLGLRRAVVTHRLAPLFSGVDYPLLDLGIAGEHLVLQATAEGLGTCWIGWIRPEVIRKLVGWPASIKPAIVFTVGWPRQEAAPPDSPAGGMPHNRLPISDLVQWLD